MSQSQLQGKIHFETVHYMRLLWHELSIVSSPSSLFIWSSGIGGGSICKSIGLARPGAHAFGPGALGALGAL